MKTNFIYIVTLALLASCSFSDYSEQLPNGYTYVNEGDGGNYVYKPIIDSDTLKELIKIGPSVVNYHICQDTLFLELVETDSFRNMLQIRDSLKYGQRKFLMINTLTDEVYSREFTVPATAK